MNFSYNKNNGKYVLGQTEYTQDEFINYIQADMLKNALAKDSSFNIIVEKSKKSAEERKQEFTDYLKNVAKTKDGQPLAKNTIGNYLSYLPKIVNFIKSNHVENVYEISSVDLVLQIQEELSKSETYLEANKNGSARYNYSSSLEQYKKYLIFEKEKDIEFFEDEEPLNFQELPSFTPSQIIYYGVPGCGKSYEVNKDINDKLDKYGITDREYHKVRCVFHPEYSNADFVGQIYPYVKPDNGGVEYRFKPGPFAEIVRRAYRNPAEPFFLIIEEINRGNAATFFGEIFQLLDRICPEDGPEELSGNIYDTGWSSYGVTNIDVNAYIRQKSTNNPDKIEYDDSIPYGDKIKFINNTAVRLPPNLSVYATMNTSDQNVFTMDNAFQRRFKSKMIRNSLDNTAQFDLKIGDTGVRWGDFREWINEKILAPETGLKKAEDKCLGGWFIKGEKKTDQNGKVSNESKDFPKDEFAEKVLKYLWNDVFKRSAAENIFLKGKVSSLTNLIELFESGEKFAAFENVFVINAADKAKLLSPKNNP
ncbi:MAG: hypothetical protein UIH18_05870 [Fibrobacteraceae bacterium]|nr:hypothetical protein [Fibrobacteraceae bacterium]